MPRKYIVRTDDETRTDVEQDELYDDVEAVMLGNTDMDAINNPITGFNFVLEVELLYFLALKSIKAFTKENEYEYIREGGVNDYVHLKRKPISKPFTFQVERYIGTDRFLDPLALGTELLLPLILYVYRHKARQGLTSEAPEFPARIYLFTGCTVMSKEYGELNAEQSSLVTETTTISYRELIVITNPFKSSSEAEEWTFKDNKESDGSYKTKYAAFAKNDNRKSGHYAYSYVDGHLTKSDARLHTIEPELPDPNEVVKRPYDIKIDGTSVKYAAAAINDLQGGVYEVSNGEDGRKTIQRIDKTEPLLNKPAWDGADGAKLKWAKGNEGPPPTPVTYPPTRRALMADALKK